MKKTIVVLAAGVGSRYGGSKQIDEIAPNGQILMDYTLYDAIKTGFNKIVFIINQNIFSELKEHYDQHLPESIEVEYVIQDVIDLPIPSVLDGIREKPWGTGHAIWCTRNVVEEGFLVVNADDYYGYNGIKKASDFLDNNKSDDEFALISYTLGDTLSKNGTVSRGVCQRNEDETLKKVTEYTKLEEVYGVVKDQETGAEFPKETPVSMNLWVCKPSLYRTLDEKLFEFIEHLTKDDMKKEIYLPFVIDEMIQSGQIKSHVIDSESQWYGLTYSSDKEIVANALKEYTKNGQYPENLWAE